MKVRKILSAMWVALFAAVLLAPFVGAGEVKAEDMPVAGQENTVTISFHGNGANGGMMFDQHVNIDDMESTVDWNQFYKRGYTFNGWNTMEDGSGDLVVDGDPAWTMRYYQDESNHVDLYAQWKSITYKVKYDGNGATGGHMSQSKFKYAEAGRLKQVAYKRTGYTFAGWNTKKNGNGTSFTNLQKVKKLSDEQGDVIKLYAQWKMNKYKIVFDGNGATGGSMPKKKCEYSRTYRLPSNRYVRAGYTFEKWNTKRNGKGKSYANGERVKKLSAKKGKKVVLYAQWKPVPQPTTETPACTHTWVENTKVVHHDAEYADKVVHHEAEYKEVWHEPVVAKFFCRQCQAWYITPFDDPCGGGDGYTSEHVVQKGYTEQVLVKDAYDETVRTLVKDAYDETVGTGTYKCSKCGATK